MGRGHLSRSWLSFIIEQACYGSVWGGGGGEGVLPSLETETQALCLLCSWGTSKGPGVASQIHHLLDTAGREQCQEKGPAEGLRVRTSPSPKR